MTDPTRSQVPVCRNLLEHRHLPEVSRKEHPPVRASGCGKLRVNHGSFLGALLLATFDLLHHRTGPRRRVVADPRSARRGDSQEEREVLAVARPPLTPWGTAGVRGSPTCVSTDRPRGRPLPRGCPARLCVAVTRAATWPPARPRPPSPWGAAVSSCPGAELEQARSARPAGRPGLRAVSCASQAVRRPCQAGAR